MVALRRALPRIDRVVVDGHDREPGVELELLADVAALVADAALLQDDRRRHAARGEHDDLRVDLHACPPCRVNGSTTWPRIARHAPAVGDERARRGRW